MRELWKTIEQIWRDVRGVSAIEFALILPVGLVMLYGAAESGYALLLDRKVTSATQSVGDIVAQQSSVTPNQLTDILNIANNILRPYPTDNLVITLASVSQNADGNQVQDWVFSTPGANALTIGNIPQGLLNATGDSVIITITSYPYAPNLSTDLFSGFTITDRAYLRPRTGGQVALNQN
tara:strand:- start:4066 stop:4605 length:540 start_codon:yes stop_codon:yes gene_type:complete